MWFTINQLLSDLLVLNISFWKGASYSAEKVQYVTVTGFTNILNVCICESMHNKFKGNIALGHIREPTRKA